MKKLLFFLAIMSLFKGFSQESGKGALELTPIIGYSSSSHIHSYFTDTSPVSGIQFGIYGDYYLNNRWSIRSGLMYQQMGVGKIYLDLFTNNYSEKTKYLTLPASINYHFGSTRKWYINYGVSVGVLMKVKANYYNDNGYIDIKDIANPIQFGLNAGIGYKIEVSPKLSIVLDNYNMLGLTKTTKEKKGNNFYMSINLGTVLKL